MHRDIRVDIVYMTNNGEMKSRFMEVPFSQVADLPNEGQWQTVQSSFSSNDVEFDISGTVTDLI